MASFNVSPEAVLELAGNVLAAYKKIETENADILSKLAVLGNTFQDSGFDIVKQKVESVNAILNSTAGEFIAVSKALQEYANILNQAKAVN